MSSNAKHYDYYMVEGDDVKKLIDAYDDIKNRRNEILGDAMKKGWSCRIYHNAQLGRCWRWPA